VIIDDIDLHFPSMGMVRPSNQEVVHDYRAEGSSCHTDYSREYLAARVDSVRTAAAQGVAYKIRLVDKVVVDEEHRCPRG
jgi:hypothetical protein